MSTEQSHIQFLNFRVRESHIVFNKLGDYKIDVNFKPSGKIVKSLNQFILDLQVEIRDVDANFHIELKTESLFSYPEDANLEEYKKGLFVLNAPAIVFPYVRAYISNLTAQSGMPTLTLPTLNLGSIGEQLKENILEI
jgi:preprotein translocase subunit SecB